MDLTSKQNVRSLLKKYNLQPTKRLGQNFLIDKKALQRIVAAALLQPADTVLEIGPGTGILTQALAEKVKKVIAVEKDPQMIAILKEALKDFSAKGGSASGGKNVEIIKGDILRLRLPILKNYKIVGALPFYVAAPIIRKFLEHAEVKPRQMVLVVQKEVAQRICSEPPRMNLLAASVQFYAAPEIISYISKKSFWPQPKVDAAILKISNFKSQISKVDKDLFFKIVKAGFSQPRKQIVNNLTKKLKLKKLDAVSWLLENKVQPTQRAETLRIEDWLNLTKTFVV